MQDLFHYIGGDISLSPTGDLQPVDDTIKGQQRILRRLLTNPAQQDANGNQIAPADCIFHPQYGSGLPAYIGQVNKFNEIKALIRSQILLEDVVAKVPVPVITLQAIADGLSCTIQYTDSTSNKTETLSFDVTK